MLFGLSVELQSAPEPAAQRLIVGNPERPGLEIAAGAAPLQVPEQGKELFLNDVLSVPDRQAQADHVAEEPVPQLIEQPDQFLHRRGGRRLAPGVDRGGRREPPCGIPAAGQPWTSLFSIRSEAEADPTPNPKGSARSKKSGGANRIVSVWCNRERSTEKVEVIVVGRGAELCRRVIVMI